jgi:hypothetical protein
MSPVPESKIRPMVENTVDAAHATEATPLSVITTVGATVGAGNPNPKIVPFGPAFNGTQVLVSTPSPMKRIPSTATKYV